MEKKWFIMTDSGECCQAADVEEAIRILQRLNPWVVLTPQNVLSEPDYGRWSASEDSSSNPV